MKQKMRLEFRQNEQFEYFLKFNVSILKLKNQGVCLIFTQSLRVCFFIYLFFLKIIHKN
jgi:hypothetical protein